MKGATLFVAPLGIVLSPGGAGATFIDTDTPADLAARAELIFEGDVLDAWTERSGGDHEIPVTRWLVELSHSYKGLVATGRVLLSTPGGEWEDGRTLAVVGTPSLELGDHVLVHAVADGQERVRLINWSDAIFTVAIDEFGDEVVLDGQGRTLSSLTLHETPGVVEVATQDMTDGDCVPGQDAQEEGGVPVEAPYSRISPDEVRDVIEASVEALGDGAAAAAAIAGFWEV